MVGKNGKKWSTKPPKKVKTGPQDILRSNTGLTSEGLVSGMESAFSIFLSDEILNEILICTNDEAKRVYAEYNANHRTHLNWQPLDLIELNGVLGLLILAGTYKSNLESLDELWDIKTGRAIFPATMTLSRFRSILRFLRFDDKRTRAERAANDKLAPIRYVWDLFIGNLRKPYVPGSDITVDEQLLAFRGRCSFIVYMPSKPGGKYGIKVWWATDAETSYPLNGQVYLGKVGVGREVGQGRRVVCDMVKPWYYSGRNVTIDNFFGSVPLAEELLDRNMTMVGTVRKNKADIPPKLLPDRRREEFSSLFAFADKLTLVSYVPKPNKAVLVLSTMHHDTNVEGPNCKPSMTMHYNATKGGVDNLDHMARYYTVKRKTNRWPLVVFYNMIDMGGIAAFIISVKEISIQV